MSWFRRARRALSSPPPPAPTSRRRFVAGAGMLAGSLFVAKDAWASGVPPLDLPPGALVDGNGRVLDRAPTGGEPYLGGLAIVAFDFAPRGWAFCNGQVLPINQNQSLYSVLGTTYGGDGRDTFALPDLRGRSPIHWGDGPGLTTRPRGSTGGQETVALPAHSHALSQVQVRGTGTVGNGVTTGGPQGTGATVATASAGTETVEQDNMQPYLTLHVVIALRGVFPSRP